MDPSKNITILVETKIPIDKQNEVAKKLKKRAAGFHNKQYGISFIELNEEVWIAAAYCHRHRDGGADRECAARSVGAHICDVQLCVQPVPGLPHSAYHHWSGNAGHCRHRTFSRPTVTVDGGTGVC